MTKWQIERNDWPKGCPKCGSTINPIDNYMQGNGKYVEEWRCDECRFEWKELYEFVEWTPKV